MENRTGLNRIQSSSDAQNPRDANSQTAYEPRRLAVYVSCPRVLTAYWIASGADLEY